MNNDQYNLKYDPDSYLLYSADKNTAFTIRVRAVMKDRVDADILNSAAQKAIKRYPYFAVRVTLDAEGGYVLEPNTSPFAVYQTKKKTPPLGSEEVNGHLASIEYSGRNIYFNIHHTLTGGIGMMEWVKTTLYCYVSEAYGITPDAPKIRKPDSPIGPEETKFPDENALPAGETIGYYTRGEGYFPLKDYLNLFLNPFNPGQLYYTLDIPQGELMRYARSNDGSPNSILGAMMFKAVARVMPEKEQTVVAASSNNFRADVGCPDTYRDFARQLYTKFSKDMASKDIETLSTMIRGSVILQQQPENGIFRFREIMENCRKTDALPTLKEKRKFNAKHGKYFDPPKGTFVVSYVGLTEWGELEKYVRSVYMIANGHWQLETTAKSGMFNICFYQVVKNTKVLDSFVRVLEEENIPFTMRGPFKKNLPGVELPSKSGR